MELIEPIHAKVIWPLVGGPTSVIFSLNIIQVKCMIDIVDFIQFCVRYFTFIIMS